MPHIPGEPASGHGRITSIQDDPPPITGHFSSTPVITGGKLVNHSGIGHNLAKFQAMPAGWYETDGYKDSFQHDHTQIERYFIGPWGGRPEFIRWAVGYSYLVRDPFNPLMGILKRVTPVQDVEFPWAYCVAGETVKGQGAWIPNPHLLARDRDGKDIEFDQHLDIDGLPIPDTGRNVRLPKIAYYDTSLNSDHSSALVKLTFNNLQYEIREDAEVKSLGFGELSRYIYREPLFNTEAIPWSKDQPLKFTEAPVTDEPVDTNAARLIIPKNGWRYHWFDVPTLPTEAWKMAVGSVNLNRFDMGTLGAQVFEPETLLCMSPVPTRYRTPAGSVAWKITYTFLVSPSEKGWNAFVSMSPAGGGFYYSASINGGAMKVFKLADFDQLFTQPFVTYQF